MNIKTEKITAKSPTIANETDWRGFYEELLPQVFHFFFYKTGDQIAAEELTAATFEKAWTSRFRYRKEMGAYRFYLFGIARKVAADYFRKRHPESRLDENLPGPQQVEEQVDRRLNVQRLSAVITVLDRRERELISLKYGAEMTNREIARLTGLSESNVGTVLHRAVLKLRQEWEKQE